MARLNFEIPDDLHDQVRRIAADRGQTLKGLVIYELRRAVARAEATDEPFEADDDGI
jgi:hypothetical protein